MTIQSKLSQLEKRARERFKAAPDKQCRCKYHGYYFVATDGTPEDVKAVLPHNIEYCPKCGGHLPIVTIDMIELKGFMNEIKADKIL